ncbi:MAG TPA: MFS transporter [Tepidisphaeraceae bacterium]|jgi:MFS family permease|nr:MFS transporter [Tepidisphaeraceae bacterium]
MNDQAAHRTFPLSSVKSASISLPWRFYSVEALASAGTNLMVSGIYFYTADAFHWNLRQNFLLATGQGLVYVVGALLANAIGRRMGKNSALTMVYSAMSAIALLACFCADRPATVTALLLGYSFCSAIGWPLMESLVSTGVDSHALSRRISIYNVVWAGVGALMLAIEGTLIVHWPAGVFLLPAVAHAVSALAIWTPRAEDGPAPAARRAATPRHGDADIGEGEPLPAATSVTESGHSRICTSSSDGPEPELLRVRTLALWLSRSVLPATYVAIFSLMALMPSLPVMQQIGEESRTLLSSTWMATRLLAFLLLGFGTWWHTRPRVLLVAAFIMLGAFFGVTVRPSDLFAHGSAHLDLCLMIGAQLALGAALGMIYSASLYFGMVLSDGSAEHGGYHEALIGIGFILGPGSGALAQWAFPTHGVNAGIYAVGGVVAMSVIIVALMSLRAGEKEVNAQKQ